MIHRCTWFLASLLVALPIAGVSHRLTAADRKPKQAAPPDKWDADILQLFFADAREKLGPGQPGGQPLESPDNPEAVSDDGNADAPQVGGPTGGFAWSGIIEGATIEDEIKAVANAVNDATKTPSEFKGGGNKAARVNYSVATLLFAVIAEYDGDVRWKADAKGLRSQYARTAGNCKVGTDASYKEARLRSDELGELVRGGKIDAGKATNEFKWAETVNRAPLMLRMGPEGYNVLLKASVADQGEFSRNREAALKEAQLVAVIGHVIQDESFEFADDETYLQLARQLEQQAKETIEAINAKDLKRAQTAVGALNQACSSCHEGYRS